MIIIDYNRKDRDLPFMSGTRGKHGVEPSTTTKTQALIYSLYVLLFVLSYYLTHYAKRRESWPYLPACKKSTLVEWSSLGMGSSSTHFAVARIDQLLL